MRKNCAHFPRRNPFPALGARAGGLAAQQQTRSATSSMIRGQCAHGARPSYRSEPYARPEPYVRQTAFRCGCGRRWCTTYNLTSRQKCNSCGSWCLPNDVDQFVTTSGLTPAQIRDLQSRELTPEDFDVLLALDNSVSKQTISEGSVCDVLRAVSPESVKSEACGICQFTFEEEPTPASKLCCEHVFHTSCVSTWLQTGKSKCPLCGEPVATD
mmetsp:Transcript_57677/g.133136  ORF Transcript_57677/g.133136 Transcript_57677/m.133136 type:complete len:213 (-) Transcript_57677:261-899(-)